MEINNKRLHPKDWSTGDLKWHLHFEMKYPQEKIDSMTREDMINVILEDEIDRE